MEFGKIKGFWNSASNGNDAIKVHHKHNQNNSNSNNNNKNEGGIDVLEEIKPEITSEGYGLRTPYGTHLNLDFVKYCEDLTSGQQRKRNYFKSRHRTASSSGHSRFHLGQSRLSSGPSVESLEYRELEDQQDMSEVDGNAENTMMETRRRLEAFRSFRTKRYKNYNSEGSYGSSTLEASQNGFTATSPTRERHNNVTRRNDRSTSPCSSSSGSGTCNSVSGLPSSNQLTPQHLQIVREQMASALVRLRELEEQVKTIPLLEVKLAILKEEKQHLLDELKHKEEGASSTTNNFVKPKEVQESVSLSVSSGTLTSSYHSASNTRSSPHARIKPEPPRHQTSLDESSDVRRGVAPSPPKRKYRSIGTGDDIPIEEIICYREGEVPAAVLVDAYTITTPPELINSSSQTEMKFSEKSSSTQTEIKSFKNTACDARHVKTRDNHCEPSPLDVRHISTMTALPIKGTRNQYTSSSDLIYSNEVGIGTELDSSSVATNTPQVSVLSRATSYEKLTQCCDAISGPDIAFTSADASISTVPVLTRNAGVSCDVVIPSQTTNQSTMTIQSGGRWVTYSDLAHAACGSDVSFECSSVATNTAIVTHNNQATSTLPIPRSDKCVAASIRPAICHASVNTTSVLKYNQATDCFDIRPVLRHNASNTMPVKGVSVSTQYVMNKSNLVESMTNTDVTDTSDASTSTSDVNTKNIDVYVDKVQTLIEEQQSLLEENYQVFSENWDNGITETDSKPTKISRFVNPFFSRSDTDNKEDEDRSTPSDPISASLSLMKDNPNGEDSSSESESDLSDISDYLVQPVLRQALTTGSSFELKSIMRKPGTSPSVKKTLRFAEGVKSDDDSSDTCSTCDESEEDDEDEEITKNNDDDDENVDDKEIEEIIEAKNDEIKNEEENHIKNKSSIIEKEEETNRGNTNKYIFPETTKQSAEIITKDKEFNYSNEFVKKSVKSVLPKEELVQEEVETSVKNEETYAKLFVNYQDSDGKENQQPCVKYIFTPQMLDACDVLEKHFKSPKLTDKEIVTESTSLVRSEWFRVAAQSDSSQNLLEDFATDLADTSLPVLRKVVNMTDDSGNTVLHYAISHGNFPVVETLLTIEELDTNKTNQAGYSSAMLAALCDVTSDYERSVFKKLFERSNVNLHAKEAGQTALMLAVCHGRLHTAQLLLSCGADINAKDEDGSTPLMCAVEHGQMEVIKMLLSRPNCDATVADSDGSTALSIAMDSGNKEIALLLYAQLNLRPSGNIKAKKTPKPRVDCKSMIPSPIQRSVTL